jgi:hypothetical protein
MQGQLIHSSSSERTRSSSSSSSSNNDVSVLSYMEVQEMALMDSNKNAALQNNAVHLAAADKHSAALSLEQMRQLKKVKGCSVTGRVTAKSPLLKISTNAKLLFMVEIGELC